MAEGYVKTSASSVNDLLNQIVSQAAIHGWTQHRLSEQGLEGRRGHISKDGVVINLASHLAGNASSAGANYALNNMILAHHRESNYNWGFGNSTQGYVHPDVLAINASAGYNDDLGWFQQPGGDTTSDGEKYRFRAIRAKGAIGNVWMFFYDDPAALFIVCEVRPGEFYWLAGGNIETEYDLDAAMYYGASLAPADVSSGYPRGGSGIVVRTVHPQASTPRPNGWGGSVPSPETGYGWNSYNPGVNAEVPAYPTWISSNSVPNDDQTPEVTRGYDPLTGRLWVYPIRTYVARVGGGAAYTGVIPNSHYCTTSHFIGSEVVTVGGEEYMIFPANWRSSPYDWDVTNVSWEQYGPWYRNNTRGTGFALRKPN